MASLGAMVTTAAIDGPTPSTAEPEANPHWTPLQKLGFRLLFTVGGGVLLLQVYANLGLFPVVEPLVWALAQVGSFLVRGHGVDVTMTSGGDTVWAWCMHLGLLVVALLITGMWTVLDRGRPNYRPLAASLHVFARFGLGMSLILYGMAKTLPTQMGYMALPDQQLRLTGDTSLFNTLWGFMGASEPYSVATGLVELVSGLLLLWNRTWVLGALGGVMAMAQVFLLNLTYDVPVKQLSGELLLVAIGVAAPYWPALVRVVFNLGDAARVRLWRPLGSDRRWLRRTGVVAKFGLAAALTALCVVQGALVVLTNRTPSSSLDGVWRATSFTVDGHEAVLDQTGPEPWTNVAITHRDRFPEVGSVRLTQQTAAGYTTMWLLKVDGDRLELRKHESDPAAVVLHATQPTNDRLVLSGEVDGKRVEGVYERRFMERSKSRFRLIQPDIDPRSIEAYS